MLFHAHQDNKYKQLLQIRDRNKISFYIKLNIVIHRRRNWKMYVKKFPEEFSKWRQFWASFSGAKSKEQGSHYYYGFVLNTSMVGTMFLLLSIPFSILLDKHWKEIPSRNVNSHSEIYCKVVITILILISNPLEYHPKATEGWGQGFNARGTKSIVVPGGNN